MSKISFSAWKKYHQCPKLYDLHYNTKLRPKGTSSPLVFGTAMDEALNALLLKTGDPLEVFRKSFEFEDMKGVVFDNKDFQKGLFTEDQLRDVRSKDYDYMCWASMRIKGRLMIEQYIEEIYPNIEKVHSVQKSLGTRRGFIDAIVDYKGIGKVLLDHKTAARPYPPNDIEMYTQLALYAEDQGIDVIGFIVLCKQIKLNEVKICAKCKHDGSGRQHATCPKEFKGNRCHGQWIIESNPEAIIQVIIDDAPQINQKLIIESISETEKLIDAKVFPRNLNACGQMYGKPCPMYDFCWKGDESMLEYKKNE